jgi:predicted XRE-type DNA-binding protein
MKKQTFPSVWDAIEDTKTNALNMKIRSALMSTLSEEVKRKRLSQADAAELLEVTQRASPISCAGGLISSASTPW